MYLYIIYIVYVKEYIVYIMYLYLYILLVLFLRALTNTRPQNRSHKMTSISVDETHRKSFNTYVKLYHLEKEEKKLWLLES